MEGLAAAIEASELAAALRRSRWTYPAVNTAHVLGIALLVGAAVPMDLRLAGIWRADIGLGPVLRLLRPMAATGAGLALVTGALLFSVQATDYAALPLFRLKLALIALALANALIVGPRLAGAPPALRVAAGLVSLALWLMVLVCGRLIGYL